MYADRAYESQRRRHWLLARGIKDRIMHCAHKYQRALTHWQQRRNALIDPIRQAVEKVFGTLKRSYGYRRGRYRGLARNAVGDVVAGHGLQPAPSGPDGGQWELSAGDDDEQKVAKLGPPEGTGRPRSLGGESKEFTGTNHHRRCDSHPCGDVMQRSPNAGIHGPPHRGEAIGGQPYSSQG